MKRLPAIQLLALAVSISLLSSTASAVPTPDRPHIILVMADDMGWGETGYYNHPVLKTPNLDAMARNGLRFDQFYAGAPVCSPTRASVLTGRTNDRTGVEQHGSPLRLQEKTVAQALHDAGYVTGHFGKWHLNGLRGPGVPILASDTHNPGSFGFDHWLSVTNFFDLDPILSREGDFVEFQGDSSEVVVAEAVKFVRKTVGEEKPCFTVIWFGTPHSPFRALETDAAHFAELDENSRNHYGELVAMDRALGTLRGALREMDIADHTLLWFCSDNGGLPKITPDTVGGLRGNKGTVFEGGLRVPAVIEWPQVITEPRVTSYPAATMDIFPTLADVTDLPESVLIQPQDGLSLKPLFTQEIGRREKPIGFRHTGKAALVDNRFKLLTQNIEKGEFELYDLEEDPTESHDIAAERPEIARRLRRALLAWNRSVEDSVAGKDYPEGHVDPNQPIRRFWMDEEAYRPYFDAWRDRPEYAGRLKGK